MRALVSSTMFNTSELFEYIDLPSSEYLSIVEKLTNQHDFDVRVGTDQNFKLKRTITELGICDSFNSKLSEYLVPNTNSNIQQTTTDSLFQLNYFDMNTVIVFKDLEDCHVSNYILCEQWMVD